MQATGLRLGQEVSYLRLVEGCASMVHDSEVSLLDLQIYEDTACRLDMSSFSGGRRSEADCVTPEPKRFTVPENYIEASSEHVVSTLPGLQRAREA